MAILERRDVHTFPSEDEEFRRHVLELLERHPEDEPAQLAERIRLTYPFASVRERDRLAALPGEGAVWYAYRDRQVHDADLRSGRRTSTLPG